MSVPRYPEQEKAPVAETNDAPWVAALPDELAGLMHRTEEEQNSVAGVLAFAAESDFAEPDPGAQTPIVVSNPFEGIESGQQVHSVSPEVGAMLQAQAQQISDLTAKLNAEPVPIHPVDAFVEAAERWYPGKQISGELLVQARAWCDALVCSTCGGSGEIEMGRPDRGPPIPIIPCPDCTVHPVDALVEVAAQMYPGEEMNPEHVAGARAYMDEMVEYPDTKSAADQEALAKARDVISRVIVPSAQDAIEELVQSGWQPEPLVRHLRLLGAELEKWSTSHGVVGFPQHSGLFALSAATVINDQTQQIADLEAKLDAERTLRAQASAELEREKSRERERRIDADGRSRDLLWALDAAIEALTPLAGYATEEDGRVAGMTAPVCLAMSSVRRADAMVKLHRALRR